MCFNARMQFTYNSNGPSGSGRVAKILEVLDKLEDGMLYDIRSLAVLMQMAPSTLTRYGPYKELAPYRIPHPNTPNKFIYGNKRTIKAHEIQNKRQTSRNS